MILLLIATVTSKNPITSPQFGFIFCFIPGIVYAFAFIKKWDLDIKGTTMAVMIIGMTIYLIVSLLVGLFYKNSRRTAIQEVAPRNIATWKINVFIVMELITFILTLFFLIKNFDSNLSAAMFAFRSEAGSTSKDIIELPTIIKLLRRFSLSLGFVVIYLLLKGYVYSYKNNRKGLLCCFILSMLNSISLGARGEAIQLIVAGVIQYLLLYKAKKGNKSIQAKSIVRILGLLVILLLSFSSVGELMGRNMSFLKFSDYIGVYLSAEIKNLDIFVRQGKVGTSLNNNQTLIYLINLLGKITGDASIVHGLYTPFRYVNGYALGNVSTTFYPFYYDGGIFGVVIYTMVMAWLTQISYQNAIKCKINNRVEFPVLLYSYVWYAVVFSFFSAKFYEMLLNTVFLWTILFWVIISKFLFSRIKMKSV